MKLDFLFPRSDSQASWQNREEPELTLDRVAPVPAMGQPTPKRQARGAVMSPRQMADWAHEMYLSGTMTWEEYALAGFPAELHPAYDRTVGALTGQPAKPDTPRDMVKEWEERLAFARRHATPFDAHIRRTEKVLTLLRRLEKDPAKRA
jgi:hypothetical protein